MPAHFIYASASNLVLNEVLLWAYYIKRDPLGVNKLIKGYFQSFRILIRSTKSAIKTQYRNA